MNDWVGPFYPPQPTPSLGLLLGAVLYLAGASIGLRHPQEGASGFDFFVKGHRDLTHGTRQNAKATLDNFKVMLEPYKGEGKLAGVLLQFPAAFECKPDHEEYARRLVDSLEKAGVVIEFRHVRWIADRTMDLLGESSSWLV